MISKQDPSIILRNQHQNIQIQYLMQPQQTDKKQIADKDKLFLKMFISPSFQQPLFAPSNHSKQYLYTPLLVSPDFINLLLEQSRKSTRQYQLKLIDEVLSIFEKRPTNSLLLYRVDQENRQLEKSILDNVVMRIIKLVQDRSEVKQYCEKIRHMLQFYKISLKNISKLTKYLSWETHCEKFEPVKLKLILEILKLYYEPKKGLKNAPENYLYLLGNRGSGLQPVYQNSQEFSFKNQLTLIIVFKPEQKPHDQTNNLLSIVTYEHGELSLNIYKNTLVLEYVKGSQETKIILTDKISEKWYRVVVILSDKSTVFYLNEKYTEFKPMIGLMCSCQSPSTKKPQSPKSIWNIGLNFTKKKSETSSSQNITKLIKQFVVGEQFFGMLGNVIVANSCWDIENKFTYKMYPFGLQNWNSLINLNQTNQLHATIIFCSLPFTCFNSRELFGSFNVFNKNHAVIGENVSFFKDMVMENNLNILGGMKIILPIFYLARFYNHRQYPELLTDLLTMMKLNLKIYDLNQQQLQKNQIFEIIGDHIHELGRLQNMETIKLIQKIYRKLSRQSLKMKFIWGLIWKINIQFEIPQGQQAHPINWKSDKEGTCSKQKKDQNNVIGAYYRLIIKIYENQRKLALSAFSFEDILYWVVQNIEVSESESQSSMYNCCIDHYLYELSLAQLATIQGSKSNLHEYLVSIANSSKKLHYHYLEIVLTNLLETVIIMNTNLSIPNNKTPSSEEQKTKILQYFKLLLRIFIRKYSTCLYIMVLSIFKRIIQRFKGQKRIVNILEDQNLKLVDFLALLADRTLHPLIISDIIYIAAYLKTCAHKSKHSQIYKEFIIYLLRRYSLVSNNNQNRINVSRQLQNNRKKSFDKSIEIAQMTDYRPYSRSWCKITKKKRNEEFQHLSPLISISHFHKHYSLSNYTPFFNLIMNLLSNNNSESNPDYKKIGIITKNSIEILEYYYRLIASQVFKENILISLLSTVETSPQKVIMMNSFHQFLLEELYALVSSDDRKQDQGCLLKHLMTIYTAFLSYIINNQKGQSNKNVCTIMNFYCLIKSIHPIGVSYIIVEILPKMIKLMPIGQLIDILKILDFQNEAFALNYRGQSANWMKKCCMSYVKLKNLALEALMHEINGQVGPLSNFYMLIKGAITNRKFRTKKMIEHQIYRSNIKEESTGPQVFSIDVILSKMLSVTSNNKIALDESYKKSEKESDAINQSEQNSPRKSPLNKKQDFKLILKQFEDIFDPEPVVEERLKQQAVNKEKNMGQFQLELIDHQNNNQSNSQLQQSLTTSIEMHYSKSYTTLQFIMDLVLNYIEQFLVEPIYLDHSRIDIQGVFEWLKGLLYINIGSSIYAEPALQNKPYLRYLVYYFIFRIISLQKKYPDCFLSHHSCIEVWAFIFNISVFPFIEGNTYDFGAIFHTLSQNNICPMFIQDLQLYLNYYDLSQFADIHNKWQDMQNQNKGIKELAKQLQFSTNIVKRITFNNMLSEAFISIFQVNCAFSKQQIIQRIIFSYYEGLQRDIGRIEGDMDDWIIEGFKYVEHVKSIEEFIKLNSAVFTQNIDNEAYRGMMRQFFKKMNKSKKTNEYSEELESPKYKKDEIVMNKYLSRTQKLFENQMVIQEQVRVRYLYKIQCRFRKIQNTWNNLWNELRIYHHLYGFWMAQKNNPEIFVYQESSKFRNFKFLISQSPTSQGIYPILEAKMLEPWHIINQNRKISKKHFNSFAEMNETRLQQHSTRQNKNNFFEGLWKNVWGNQKKHFNHQYRVLWISRSEKAYGRLYIENKQQIIFVYESTRQDDSHLAFQKFVLDFHKETLKKWEIHKIYKVRIHRYLLKYTAINIIFNDSNYSPCQLIFHFIDENKEEFLKQLEKIQKEKLQNSNHSKIYKLNRVPFFMETAFDYDYSSELKDFLEKWKKREISNFEYLLKLNQIAFRGTFDLSQYPVFPWIAEMKSIQKEPVLRDLSKNMGALGSEERKNILLQKFYSHDPFSPYPPFFYGTHYSSPGVIFNLMIRLSPFTEYCKQLQGGKFDIPDRLFSSLTNSWKSATQQVSDVRELIPEFYYIPELLINIDENYFGKTQLHEIVNHVELPKWGATNPYYFVMQLKLLMESQETSLRINKWIDLIFGYKQKGKQAEDALNIYYYLTYEQYLNDDEEDEVYKKSKEAQIMHFGQMPPILFQKPHPCRSQGQHKKYELYFTKKCLIPNLKSKPISIFTSQSSSSQTIILKRQQIQIVSLQSNPCSVLKVKKINIEKSIKKQYYLIRKQTIKAVYFSKSCSQKISANPNNTNDIVYLLVYGYLDNEFRIFSALTGEVMESDQLDAQIKCCYVNAETQLIVLGLANGCVIVYEIKYQTNDISIKKVGIQVFPNPITHISFNQGLYSISFGNFCAIYKISRTFHYAINSSTEENVFKFFRSFENALPINHSVLIFAPLPCIVITDNANIKVISINGQMMRIKSLISKTSSIERITDKNFNEMILIHEDDKFYCLTIPDLRTVSVLELYHETGHTNAIASHKDMYQTEQQKIQWILEGGIVGGAGWIKFIKWEQQADSD